MKNEYFQNDVIDLPVLGDIGSVCIYRFPILTPPSVVFWGLRWELTSKPFTINISYTTKNFRYVRRQCWAKYCLRKLYLCSYSLVAVNSHNTYRLVIPFPLVSCTHLIHTYMPTHSHPLVQSTLHTSSSRSTPLRPTRLSSSTKIFRTL